MDTYGWTSSHLARFMEIGFRDARFRFRSLFSRELPTLDDVKREELVQKLMVELGEVAENLVVVGLESGHLSVTNLKKNAKVVYKAKRSLILKEEVE
jgi:hypothetical protein